jgi:hypothetical protein
MNSNWTIELIREKVKVLKDNVIYRIADCIKFQKSHKVVKELLSNSIYKNTLLYQFHYESDKDFYNIIKRNKSLISDYFDENYILVHLRTGDDLTSRGILSNSDKLLKQLKKYKKEKKIIIVTAMHYGHHCTDKSIYSGEKFMYNDESYNTNIKLIYDFIQKLEHQVEDIMSNEDVDIDLLHLVFCKNLVASVSAGGFAKNIIEWHNKSLE